MEQGVERTVRACLRVLAAGATTGALWIGRGLRRCEGWETPTRQMGLLTWSALTLLGEQLTAATRIEACDA